ncbi:MAG: hypothetical protein MZV70_13145 [Desulfobacterales bacterium]|nr:hypothetical protein [Desulfobacterales bacterium]
MLLPLRVFISEAEVIYPRQMSILLGVIKAVSHQKTAARLMSGIKDRHLYLSSLPLVDSRRRHRRSVAEMISSSR